MLLAAAQVNRAVVVVFDMKADGVFIERAAGLEARGQLRGTETILLVEDEEPIRELVRKVLVRYGYNVLAATDVFDALDIAKRHSAPIHLLLSDIVMPELSGPDLAQRIVRHRRDIRVLYMSGFSNRLGIKAGALSAAVAVIDKPFTPEVLATRVRECLSAALQS